MVSTYLADLETALAPVADRILVMRSSGGLASIESASELAASILLSGPAAGVVAAAACGSAHGWATLISFDMGGTSTDVCRIEGGRPEVGPERSIAGFPCRLAFGSGPHHRGRRGKHRLAGPRRGFAGRAPERRGRSRALPVTGSVAPGRP